VVCNPARANDKLELQNEELEAMTQSLEEGNNILKKKTASWKTFLIMSDRAFYLLARTS
jgi:hypothetical protein